MKKIAMMRHFKKSLLEKKSFLIVQFFLSSTSITANFSQIMFLLSSQFFTQFCDLGLLIAHLLSDCSTRKKCDNVLFIWSASRKTKKTSSLRGRNFSNSGKTLVDVQNELLNEPFAMKFFTGKTC